MVARTVTPTVNRESLFADPGSLLPNLILRHRIRCLFFKHTIYFSLRKEEKLVN